MPELADERDAHWVTIASGAGTSGTHDNTNAGEDYQSNAGTSGTGTGRPLLFNDLTISDTDNEEYAGKPIEAEKVNRFLPHISRALYYNIKLGVFPCRELP